MAHAGKFREREPIRRGARSGRIATVLVAADALIDLQLENVKAYNSARAESSTTPPPTDDRATAARSAVVTLLRNGAELEPRVRENLNAADPATAPPSQQAICKLAWGLADYREGTLDNCVSKLEDAAAGRLTPEAKTAADIFRAMAMMRLGQAKPAQALFDSFRKSFEGFPTAGQVELDDREVQDRLICQLAMREAAKLFATAHRRLSAPTPHNVIYG